MKEEKLEWLGIPTSKGLQDEKKILTLFDMRREKALDTLWEKFKTWNKSNKKLDFSKPIAIGLTYGYSSALKRILEGICEHVKDIKVYLIRSGEAPPKIGAVKKISGEHVPPLGDEEILKAELEAEFKESGLKCDILPIDAIQKREMERRIDTIFVGIESINREGDIVHPRGGSEVIREIRKYNENIEVYAFGESYKVQDFTEWDIDYTKLSLFLHENINFVVTDHGVHEREGFSIDAELEDDLNKSIISEKLKDIFKTKGFPLSDNAMVTKEKEKGWVITDKEKFIIRKENGKLNINREGKKWKIEGKLKDNLDCCAEYWIQEVRG